MKKIKFAFTVIKIFMKNQIQNKSFLILDTINMFSRCFIVFLLYGYVFRINGGVINGTDYKTVLWSMFIYFCIMTFNIRKIDDLIMQDVKSGNVEVFLNKPINYVSLSFYKILGRGLYSFVVISLVGSIIMAIFVGVPDVSLTIFILTFIVTFILGIILSLIMYSIVGLMAFFMQDVRPIHWVTDKFVMVLGGSYLPIALFPPFMKLVAFISPFGAVNFITSTVYSSWNSEFLQRIGIQVMWVIVFYILLKIVFNKAKKKAMINGG